jgi:hypothetical protein
MYCRKALVPDIRTVLLCPCFAYGPGADQHKFVAYVLAGTGNDRTDIVIYVAYSRCLLIAKSQGVETGVSKKLAGGAGAQT